MVEVTIGGVGELKRSEADVVQGLIIDSVSLIGVLHQLVHGEGGVVGLHHSVRDLGARHHAVAVHDPVGVFLPDLGDEESAHARARPPSQAVGQLEPLEAVAALSLLPDNIQDTVHQLRPLRVVTLGPVVASSRLTKHEVVGPEKLPIGARPHGVHGPGLKVNQHSTGYVLPSSGFIVVNVDSFQLKVTLPSEGASGVDSMLITNDFPKLSSNLVSVLTSLHMNNFPHSGLKVVKSLVEVN